jgi:hypothetical protein
MEVEMNLLAIRGMALNISKALACTRVYKSLWGIGNIIKSNLKKKIKLSFLKIL